MLAVLERAARTLRATLSYMEARKKGRAATLRARRGQL